MPETANAMLSPEGVHASQSFTDTIFPLEIVAKIVEDLVAAVLCEKYAPRPSVVDDINTLSTEDDDDDDQTSATDDGNALPIGDDDAQATTVDDGNTLSFEETDDQVFAYDDESTLLPEVCGALTPLGQVSRKFYAASICLLYKVHTVVISPRTDLVGRVDDCLHVFSYVRRLTLTFRNQPNPDSSALTVRLLSPLFNACPFLWMLHFDSCSFGGHAADIIASTKPIALDELVISHPYPFDPQYPHCLWEFLKLFSSIQDFQICSLRNNHDDNENVVLPQSLRVHLEFMDVHRFTLSPVNGTDT